VVFGTLPLSRAIIAFIGAIREIHGSNPLASEPPSVVAVSVSSAAGGRGYTGCLSSGKNQTGLRQETRAM
jgi:hypothetical protein